MNLLVDRKPDALREGISIKVDGLKGSLLPRWSHIGEEAVMFTVDLTSEKHAGLYDKLNGFRDEPVNAWLTRDPRMVLQSLRWLLRSMGLLPKGINLRRIIQDEEEARAELIDLQDRFGHIIAERWSDQQP